MKKRNFLFCCTGDQYKGPLYFAGSWPGANVLGAGLLVGGAAVVGSGFSSTIITGIVAGSMAAKMLSMVTIANGGLIAAAQPAGAAGRSTSTSECREHLLLIRCLQ